MRHRQSCAGSGSGWGGNMVSNIASIAVRSGTASRLGAGLAITVLGMDGGAVGVAVATSAPSSIVIM